MKLFLLLGALFSPLALAGVQPGNWEFTVEVSIAQGDSASGPVTRTRCISEEEARDPQKVIAEAGHSGCQFSDARDTGAEYTFSIDCSGGRVPVHGNGRLHYTAQTLEGVIDLVAEQQNLRIVTHSNVKARRLGACHS
jgi:uncharacterized protein DUF3617